ncbi:multidrug resistance-associated protein 5 isoform X1 [Strongylocentrotus purpuratus]|uniref:Multidrug resistance-associated protein 5 n=1 Tax=Strongylocentrotus purpuratus TaxID=7668 RepID=A0A7M7NJL1_STRPU|nr:multidrug resistance-associated protein 5 isoform X1 [Strongylocentrotus purpuratus]XP_030837609.1 multidrug resistance-associated protein 5 isoform X2 [Strongylocentrotus purpuratus]XP_030837610.1 multidrug resistance-associated protein 5 isoform X1 [Strongylocentrotus purpuratus]
MPTTSNGKSSGVGGFISALPADLIDNAALAEIDVDEGVELVPEVTYRDLKEKKKGVAKYKDPLKVFYPVRRKPKEENYSPLDHYGLFSFLTVNWLTKLFVKAVKNNIEFDDLYDQSELDSGYLNGLRFEKMWDEEVAKVGQEKVSMGKIALKFVRTRLVIIITALIGYAGCLIVISSFLVQELLIFCDEVEAPMSRGYILVCSILAVNIIRVMCDVVFWMTSMRTATRLRSGILSFVFKKIARLRNLQDRSVGEIVNICANDSQRLFDVCVYGNFLFVSIVLILAVLVSASLIIGWAAICGVLLTFIFFWPLQMIFGKITSILRDRCISVTDERVQKMNEVLTYVKLIKMYAWEVPFSKAISAIRNLERSLLEKAGYMQSFSLSISPITPNIATVLTIVIFLSSDYDEPLTSTNAFTLVAILNTLRAVIGPTPWAIRSLAEANIALGRLKSVFVMDEQNPLDILPRNDKYAVIIRNGVFGWDRLESGEQEEEEEEEIKLKSRAIENGANNNERKVAYVHTREVNLQVDLDEEAPSKKSAITIIEPEKPHGNADAGKKANEQGKRFSIATKPVSLAEAGLDTVAVDKLIQKSKVHPRRQIPDDKVSKVLFGINFALEKGKLTGVCGTVGAGKTSLISAILGQMHNMEGDNCVQGAFAYAAQEAWIFNATVKNNILFGIPFDEDRYDMVLDACSLKPDLAILPMGDQTEIGERGINMSGGQKQRISLARALYSDRDIYLLDDPLSAVDAHVGLHIFTHCISTALKGKTVLFVTHQLQYLKDCDLVMTMMDGRIVERGHHDELMSVDGVYANLINTFHSKQEAADLEDLENPEADEDMPEQEESMVERRERAQSQLSSRSRASSFIADAAPDPEPAVAVTDGKLMSSEDKSTKSVGWGTYGTYIKSMGGYHMGFLVLFCFILMFGSITLNNMYLTYWLNQGNGTDPDGDIGLNPDAQKYQLIYGLSLIVIMMFGAFKSLVFMKVTLKAASHMHDTVFINVFRSPMSFFDTTPTGRILNRFSKDLDEVDVLLPFNLELFLQNIFLVSFALIVICIIFPIFIAIIIPTFIIFIIILRYYRKGIRDLKRIENITRSPWFSHISATVQGLSTIHAYNKTDDFIVRFRMLLDGNALPYMFFRMSARWAGVRLETLVILLAFVAHLLVVLYHGEIDSATAGLAVSYTVQLTGMFQMLVLMASETEARFTSVERIQSYMKNLVAEAPRVIKNKRPAKQWPDQGQIEFRDFKMRYRDGLPLVLKGVKLVVKPNEKVGIVGRTGSGKSTLGVALFRLVEGASGQIIIDGIDVKQIGLHDLRSKLSIIPQDPVLFIGTVRYNLDPFNEHGDKELWEALERSYMKDRISALESQLEAPVTEGGDNFSVGERQLMCMARALLRGSKILMLDEATAAIDTETDSLIQQTIREEFKDCTMLTVAHRLNTILDSDKVLVMDDGMVAEFDKPSTLLANPNSLFSGMVAAAESAQNR